jgi:ABC-type Fe3+ transport system permease subunit
MHSARPSPAALALALAALLLVAVPLVWAILRALSRPASDSAPSFPALDVPALALTTTLVPMAIALAAQFLAWPTAWLLMAIDGPARRLIALLLALPSLMPVTLAYAGFGLLASPAGLLGGLVPASATLNQLVALAAIALWLWPISVALLWPALRATPASELDALAQSGASPLVRARWFLARHRQAAGASLLTTTLIALGATVPLHLAQVNTVGVAVWSRLALDPAGPGAWSIAWPIVLLTLALALLAARSAPWPQPVSPGTHRPTISSPAALPASAAALAIVPAAAWLTAVAVPLLAALFVAQSSSAFALAWQDLTRATTAALAPATTGPLIATIALAALVALLTFTLAVVAFRAGLDARAARPATAPLITTALVLMALAAALPGVLVGAALATTLASVPWLQGTTLPLALGHTARFGIIAVLAGVALARLEPPALTDARRQLAGDKLAPWAIASLVPALPALTAAALACAALSTHEIETTIQLQPPGYRGVAQLVLDYLHMNSARQLGATLAIVLAPAIALAVGAGLLLQSTRRSPLHRPPPPP